MEQESIPIRETLKIHKIERNEMKGIYGLKFFFIWQKVKNHSLHNGIPMEKMFWYAAMMTEKSIPTIVLPVRWYMIKPKNGSNVLDCVNSGSTNNIFAIKFRFS